MKKIILLFIVCLFLSSQVHALGFKSKDVQVDQQPRVNYPAKYDDIYLSEIKKEYKNDY